MTAEETLKIWKEWKKCIDDLGLDACVLNAMSEYKNAELKEAKEIIEGALIVPIIDKRCREYKRAVKFLNKQDKEKDKC